MYSPSSGPNKNKKMLCFFLLKKHTNAKNWTTSLPFTKKCSYFSDQINRPKLKKKLVFYKY